MPKKEPDEQTNPAIQTDLQATREMLLAFRAAWQHEINIRDGMDRVRASQLSVVALTQLAAIVAVNIGMPIDNFLKVCGANHIEAYRRAPKFG